MDEINITPREAIIYGALINAGVGLILGLVPLITGIVKRNIKYGLLGFICSALGGAVLGVILSVPVSALFTWMIIRKAPAAQPADE